MFYLSFFSEKLYDGTVDITTGTISSDGRLKLNMQFDPLTKQFSGSLSDILTSVSCTHGFIVMNYIK